MKVACNLNVCQNEALCTGNCLLLTFYISATHSSRFVSYLFPSEDKILLRLSRILSTLPVFARKC